MMNKRRVMDLVVVAAVAAVVGLVAGSYEPLHRRWAINLGLLGAYELTPLAERYKTRESFFAEEWIFRDFFRDQRDGFFVEIGAGPHQTGSNTYFLEKERGWRGIAVDALERYRAEYERHRPATRFFSFFVSDVSDANARVRIPEAAPGSASDNHAYVEEQRRGGLVTNVEVPTITMNDLLHREGVNGIDLLIIDIELSEPRALSGFDVERYRPRLVCIESHAPVRQAILDYFHFHGYVVVGKYLRMDNQNLYFTIREPAGERAGGA